jgi:NCS1 family nucleobase:cation symporter-1
VHTNNVASNLAFFYEISKSYSSQRTCHLGTDALLLPLHNNPITPLVAARLQIEIPIYGKDHCDANIWSHLVHMGFSRRYVHIGLFCFSSLSNTLSAKGFGPTFSKGTNIKDGTPAVVVFFQCVTTAIGPKATLALNMPDFTRYAKYPKQVFWTQATGLCVLVTLCGILGVTVTSACQQVYGVTTWNPLQVSVLWENRAAQFFSALCWMFAVIGTNISANSVSFSNDLSLWFPSWINARRGAYVCCIISIAATPWNIQYSAASFSAFLGGYAMFLGPIAGIMMSDFWILRNRHLNLSSLYRHPDIYSFFHGFNLRAFAAFICGIAPNLAGLAKATGNAKVPKGATYVYSLSWLVGTVVAFVVYTAAGKIWPMEEKFDDGQVMDGVERSSLSNSDEEVKAPGNEKALNF